MRARLIVMGLLVVMTGVALVAQSGWRVRQGSQDGFVGTVAYPVTDGADLGTTAQRWTGYFDTASVESSLSVADGEITVANGDTDLTVLQGTYGTAYGQAIQLNGANDWGMVYLSTGTGAFAAWFDFIKTSGNGSAVSIVEDGDELGRFNFYGDDGVNVQARAAAIRVTVDGTPGANDMPGAIEFWTSPDGSDAIAERLSVNNAGTVRINGLSGGDGSSHVCVDADGDLFTQEAAC